METIDAECRKCGVSFTTAAKTRTTCPNCKGAVTVKRCGDIALRDRSSWNQRDSQAVTVDLADGGPVFILLGFGALWLWRMIRGKA